MPARLLLSAILMAVPAMSATAETGGGPIRLAYYPSWLAEWMPPSTINFGLLTHVAHAFLLAKEDGSPVPTGRVPSRELTSAAHGAGVKVILSLGGWGSDRYYAPMVQSEAAMRTHVQEVVRIVAEHDYDGVDLDWEHPDDARDREAFAFFAREFRAALDELGKERGRSYELSAALNPSEWSGRWLDEKALAETMDYLNIMTYDFSGPWGDHANHHSPLYSASAHSGKEWPSVERGMRYWWEKKGFPKDRLNVGIPLYGRGFRAAQPYRPNPREGRQWERSELGYRDAAALIRGGWRREWDAPAGVPWLYAPDGTAVIGYDDAESVAGKTKWARENGFRGVFFWALGHDYLDDKSQPLLEAAAAAWK